jgi:predicted GH43/DUF377 family glycosyl hydrolase
MMKTKTKILIGILIIGIIFISGCVEEQPPTEQPFVEKGLWEKHPNNPIVAVPSEVGGWGIGDPTIIKDEDALPEERYKMWYVMVGGDGFYYATSPDGIRWELNENNPALEPETEPNAWDQWIETPFVMKDKDAPPEERYKMYYAGSKDEKGEGMSIGLATSPDGIHWKRYENNPVIKDIGNYDGISGPSVIRDDNAPPEERYKMWYDGWIEGGYVSIGYATSPDGKNWKVYENNPVLDVGKGEAWDNTWVAMPSVIKTKEGYELWYGGVYETWNFSKVKANIGYATSSDGIHWTKHPDNPVLRYTEEWEQRVITMPTVILDQGMYKMWYVGLKYLGESFEEGWIYQLGYATLEKEHK